VEELRTRLAEAEGERERKGKEAERVQQVRESWCMCVNKVGARKGCVCVCMSGSHPSNLNIPTH
jgi:hypothetical protein